MFSIKQKTKYFLDLIAAIDNTFYCRNDLLLLIYARQVEAISEISKRKTLELVTVHLFAFTATIVILFVRPNFAT